MLSQIFRIAIGCLDARMVTADLDPFSAISAYAMRTRIGDHP